MKRIVLAAGSALCCVVVSGVSRAEVVASGTDVELTEIVITGSRLAAPGLTSTTAVTSVDAEDFERRGASNLGDALTQLPVFSGSITSATAAGGFGVRNGTAQGNIGGAFLNLRGLGANRTLTMLDGHRLPPAAVNGTVDINTIPSLLVNRTEIVTGGASAAYGSDAVAGVVNVIIDSKLEGIRGDLSYGVSEYGDDQTARAQLAAGMSFSDGRGHVIVAGEFFNSEGVGDLYERPWGRLEYQTIPNPCYGSGRTGVPTYCPAGGNGLPANVTAPHSHFPNQTYGGLIQRTYNAAGAATPSALSGTQFLPGGATSLITYGDLAYPVNGIPNGTQMLNSPDGVTYMQRVRIYQPNQRYNLFGRASFDFTDSLETFVEAAYGHNVGSMFNPQLRQSRGYRITLDNAYLPAPVRAAMQAQGIGSFDLTRVSTDIGHPKVIARDEQYRGLIGARLRMGDKWSLFGYFQHGETRQDNSTAGSIVADLFAFSRDAVVDPASGQIVCRATLPGPAFNAAAAGCVPVNLFGEGSPSVGAIQYFTGTQQRDTTLKQDTAEVTLQGSPFATWAGDVAVASGVGYRKDRLRTEVDPLSAASRFDFGNATNISGDITVKEAFGEIEVPLLRDVAIAQTFGLNGAVRYSNYSSSGGVTTWKVGVTWRPIQDVLIRAARSRDIRSPNIGELFTGQSTSQTFRRVFADDRNAQALITTILGGNPNLQPERATTDTFGIAYTPSWASGLSLQADYYNIRIIDAIGTLDANIRIDRCFAGDAAFCEGITIGTVNGRTQVTSMQDFPLNIDEQLRKGIDFQFNYAAPLSRISSRLPGSLNLNTVVSYAKSAKTITPLTTLELVNSQQGLPRYRVDSVIGYSVDRASLNLRVSHIPSMIVDVSRVGAEQSGYSPNLPNSVNFNHTGSRTYFGLGGAYDIPFGDDGSVQVYATINNLLNKDPPLFSSGPTNYAYFDGIGRMYTVGLRGKF